MCGRFVSARKRAELLEEFAVQRDSVAADRQADYNVAPTKRIYTVLDHQDERELRLVRWGLVPSWAKDIKVRCPADQRTGRDGGGQARLPCRVRPAPLPHPGRRLLRMADRSSCLRGRPPYPRGRSDRRQGYRTSAKQPFYIYRTDGGILAFAGIYELWKNPEVPEDHEDAWYWSASIITTDATDEIGKIHDRTPMVIAPADWAEWLDPANREKEHLLRTMHPAMTSGGGGLTARPVSTTVNSVRNNGPDLIAPLAG